MLTTTCSTCGSTPCVNPRFCDVRTARGEPPCYIEPSRWQRAPDQISPNWHEMSIEVLMANFDRARRRDGAPQPTVEALMFSLRERGTKALEQPGTRRRLSELSDQQVIEGGN